MLYEEQLRVKIAVFNIHTDPLTLSVQHYVERAL